MKNAILATVSVLISLSGSSVLAAPSNPVTARTIQNSPALVELMRQLSEAATSAPSLAFFGYSEKDRYDGGAATCRAVSAEEIVAMLRNIAATVLTPGMTLQPLPSASDVERAYDDFRSLLAGENYLECERRVSEVNTYTVFTYFQSRESDYRIRFQIGYED